LGIFGGSKYIENFMMLSIDFGTCNSSAALIGDGTIKPIKEPLKHGYSFPSSVYLTEQGDFLIGQAAENNRLRDIRRYRTKFKKELGNGLPCRLGDRSFSSDELVTEVLRKLKIEAEKTVIEVITNVVITIPATYQKFKRDLMKQAAQAAGFSKISLLEEPVAAAIYYTRQSGNLLKDGDIILVYDLGGGTFDASLIKKQGDWFQILGSPIGLENCGGTDFDREIYHDFKRQCSSDLREKLEQETAWRPRAIIAEQCINIKHQLSEDLEATIDISLGFDELESYHLTRANFDRMIAPSIAKTINMCDHLIQSVGLDWHDLQSVLVVGGSCRIPFVQQALQQRSGRSSLLVDEPELAVCQGAAIYGVNLGSNAKRDTSDQTTQDNRASTPLSPRQLYRLKSIPVNSDVKVRMRDVSTIIQDGDPVIYQLPLKRDSINYKLADAKFDIAKYHIGQPNHAEEKVIMIVGATGEGKTTLINSMVNYILGVEYEDDFRFKLTADEGIKSKDYGQIEDISAYTIYKMDGARLPYNLTVIDTPGYGDTEGVARDNLIADLIRKFFNAPTDRSEIGV
jgi:molecular chaperone DnaK